MKDDQIFDENLEGGRKEPSDDGYFHYFSGLRTKKLVHSLKFLLKVFSVLMAKTHS